MKRFWQNYLHPSINKSVWKQDEIDKLKGIVEEYNCCHWDKIAEALGVRIEKFMHFQNSCLCEYSVYYRVLWFLIFNIMFNNTTYHSFNAFDIYMSCFLLLSRRTERLSCASRLTSATFQRPSKGKSGHRKKTRSSETLLRK